MLEYPQFDPVMIHIGPLALRWYGMMYVFGILSGWLLGRYRAKKPWNKLTPALVDDFVTWAILGVVLGGRIGYVLFYNLAHYIEQPLKVFAIWEGGMSFHGGLIGVLLVIWLFGRANNMSFPEMGDFVSPLIPPGLFFGRIGNFINGELWGRYTDHPFGMIFPGAGTMPRHPSQLYEAALEGAVLFVLVWWYSAKPRPAGCVGALFLLGYGLFRFAVEFARQPDAQLGFVALSWMTMGQILCIPMILFGASWLLYAYILKK
ncbi:prolipoprotein diacylglyceryl transferase [Pseudodesulfovibrio portus]|uniref:Phosphatidylglycerol--prolipoprotein diacylglyceryl transferase n=1 Tax=Pseudodesulfovibrio portus TaxID=231439 RepID=A0ABM8ATW2_9BACT|nr:prolipoprotein diacylglyceryl transferase [Pseudodesulfovibrio portus]BDQ34951.1 prolipoprotein diacylglyceryl transferase [Pseudodesulfovibrio portus]